MRACSAGLSGCSRKDGICPHIKLADKCPSCGAYLVKVLTTGHVFCSSNNLVCGWESALMKAKRR